MGLMGRKKLWDTQVRLPLTEEVTDRIAALLHTSETRLDFIRGAIEAEIERRSRSTQVDTSTPEVSPEVPRRVQRKE